MKNSFKYIVAIMAFFAAGLTFSNYSAAQDDGVGYSKTVSGPDQNGVYTISLEAWVTGTVTVKQEGIPADIVLVLDVSTSMKNSESGTYGDYSSRMAALQASVLEFIDIIDKNDKENAPEGSERLGNRIAIVPFGGSLGTGDMAPLGLTYLTDKSTLTTKAGYLVDDNYISKTNPAVGLEQAKTYLDGANRKSTKTVVLFTDGCPASTGSTTFNYQYAYNAVNNANSIKTAEYEEDGTNKPIIFTIGLFTDLGNNETLVMDYMNYASSNYPTARATNYSNSNNNKYITYSTGDGTYGGNYFQMAGDNDLTDIFKTVAEASGGSSVEAASESSVIVDVVASTFSIPTNADLGSVKVYQVACTQASADADLSWSSVKEDITSSVTVVPNTTTGEVSVTGFDYAENWCGWDAQNNKPHGNKLVLEIPITVNEDAVGGPAVETNASGSQLIIKDSDGNVVKSYDFVSPTLKIPVSIWIQKQGLVGEDSAVFNIRKTKYIGTYDENGNRIDYTADSIEWENFTKVVVNNANMVTVTDSNGNQVKVVKVSGLDPDYVYKIQEDAWAFGYEYQDNGTKYTIGENIKNPFVIVNTPKDVKKAEAVVRNIFSEKKKETVSD